MWISHGFDSERFWHITPADFALHMRACGDRMDRQHHQSAWQAFVTARLPVQPNVKFADLVTAKKQKTRQQTPDQQQIAFEALFLGLGGSPDQLEKVREKHKEID